MRIAYFTDTFSYINGINTSIINFSTGLAQNSHQVMIFAPEGNSVNRTQLDRRVKVELVSSVTLDRLYPNFQVAKPQIPKTFRKIRDFAPDIIHFHTPFIMGAEAMIYAKLLKKPLIGTFHGYFMEPEYMKVIKMDRFEKGANFLGRFLWKYNNFFYNRCDVVISPSRHSSHDLRQHGLKKSVQIVYNPVDLKLIKFSPAHQVDKLKKKYWLGDKVVVYVGRLSQEKSLNILVLAFQKVLASIPDAQLLLIGSGPIERELRDLTIGLGIERNVIFTGEINHHDLLTKGYYQLGKMFVSTSTSECQPMTIIEAIAFGLPIVCAKARGNIEMIKGNGILCRGGDINGFSRMIVRCLRNEKLRMKLSHASTALIQQYALDKVAHQLQDIYQRYQTADNGFNI